VWGREVDGLSLTFHLAGINNQNFLMRDDQTGTFWQQISGAAVAGPLKGRKLALVPSDELSFALWKGEQPNGTVVKDVAAYKAEYSPEDWDVRMSKVPTVLSYAQPGLTARTLVMGVHANGAARAYPYDTLVAQKLTKDRVGGVPIMLVLGPDGKSLRAFRAEPPGARGETDFYRIEDGALTMDSATGSRWNFQGCAVDGPAKGSCLDRIEIIKDYWFDWRNYNPATTVFRTALRTSSK
jgi:hypothetical protein